MNFTFPDPPPNETTLLPSKGESPRSYLKGIIGKLDLTLRPVVPAGSIIQIDTRRREILPKKNWTHALQRPIYFLKSKEGYFCGWCELDEDAQFLLLIPHPLSGAPPRRWRYRTEVENVGRVMGILVRQEE